MAGPQEREGAEDAPVRTGTASRVAGVRVLGPVQLVAADGSAIDVPGSSQRRLLGLLALHEGRTVRAELLSEELGVSAGALRKIVSRLRSLAGDDHVRTDPIGYTLTLDVDAARFTELHRAAGTAEDRLAALDEALALWHGDVLDEFATEPWAAGEVARLEALRSSAVEERTLELLHLGREAEALAESSVLIAAQPLADRPRALQMRSLAALGRPSDALRAYQTYRTFLGEEVGTEPSETLRDVEQRIATGWDGRDQPRRETEVPRSARSRPIPGGPSYALPRPAVDWIGSLDAVKRAAEELLARRIVTLTGPGGVGKTRSALEIGRRCAEVFEDGVALVELAPITRADDVVPAFASALGIPTQPGLSVIESVVDWCAGRSMLLVIDNCEHVTAAAANLVGALVRGAESVSVLATSRERLGVAGERVVTVPALGPADSVELFIERARSVDDSIEFSDDDIATIAAICERIDGVPLAIELAAARARSLSLDDLLARLDDRFALLRPTRSDGPTHHRTLRDTIDWSYQLLGPDEQCLFDRLGIFAGSFDLEAVLAVCAAAPLETDVIVDLIGSLVDKSMVSVERRDGVVRYRLLETLRHYAEERRSIGGGDDDLARRHLEHYVAVAERANAIWLSPDQIRADAVFDREWDNLRAAHATALADQHDRTLNDRLLLATITHASYRMRTEHGDWGEKAVATRAYDLPPDPYVTGWVAWWAMVTGRYQHAIELAERGLETGRPPTDRGIALCLGVASFSYWSSARRDEGRVHVDALRPALASLDVWAEYNARRAVFSFSTGEQLEEQAQRIAELAESIGAPSLISSARFYQGAAMRYLARDGGTRAALAFHEEGIALARASRADFPESQNLHGLCMAKLDLGDDDVGDRCAETIQRLYGLRYWLYLWPVVDGSALLLAKHGELDAAARILGHLDAHVPAWHAQPRTTTRELIAAVPSASASASLGRTLPRDSIVRFTIELRAAMGSR